MSPSSEVFGFYMQQLSLNRRLPNFNLVGIRIRKQVTQVQQILFLVKISIVYHWLFFIKLCFYGLSFFLRILSNCHPYYEHKNKPDYIYLKEIFCGVCIVILKKFLYLSTQPAQCFQKKKNLGIKIERGRLLLGKQREHSK